MVLLMNYKKALQLFLLLIAAYDIYLGVLGLFFRGDAVAHAANFFNFNLEVNSSTFWLIGLFSTYLIAFAGFLIVAATDPVKYIKIIYISIGIFVVRIVQRFQFMSIAVTQPDLAVNSNKSGFYLFTIIATAVVLSFLTFKVKSNKSK